MNASYKNFTPAELAKAFDPIALRRYAIALELAALSAASMESSDPHCAASGLLAKLGYDLQQAIDMLRRAMDYEVQAQLEGGLITYSQFCHHVASSNESYKQILVNAIAALSTTNLEGK